MQEIIVVVEGGRVTDIFSTEDCVVDVIDLDINDDYDAKVELEDKVQEIRDSNEYKCVY